MIPGIVDSAVAATRAFTDEFSGTGSLAQRWTSTRGSWSVVAGKSFTATAASSYPLATFNANTIGVNVRVDYGTADTHGWGVAFWVKDADNWWAVVTDKTFGYTCPSGGTLIGTNCKLPDTTQTDYGLSCAYSCPEGTTLSGTGCYSLTGCSADCVYIPEYGLCFCGSIFGPLGLYSEVPTWVFLGAAAVNCTPYPIVTTIPGATYAATAQYSYSIRLIKSVSGVVSQVDSKVIETTTTSNSTIGYVQASVTKAGTITATAQMSSGGAIQTLTHTPSSPITGKRHGFILAPITSGNQSTGMERFVYSPV
jgi:hypothetical protein